VVDYFKEMGWSKAMTSRAGDRSKDNEKVDILNVDFNIQCKSTNKCINYVDVIEEMPDDGKINLVFNRVKNKGEYVMMSVEDFKKIINM
jgi:hypothetical protein